MAGAVYGPPTPQQLFSGYNTPNTPAALASLQKIFPGTGGGMIPLPSITGGAAGPSNAANYGGNIGPVTFQSPMFKSNNLMTYVVIGAVVLVGIKLWRK